MALYVYYVRGKSSALLIGPPCKSLEDTIICKSPSCTLGRWANDVSWVVG